MGNVEAIVNKTSIEYERVKKERKLDRDWMNIEDILSFQTSNLGLGRDGSIDLGHLGILYYMDDNKDGRFTLKEMHLFIARCCAREERWDKSFTEMQTQCQAWCTLLMWNSVIETGEHSVKKSGGGNSVQPERVGVKRFKVWMVKVLSRVRPYKTFNSKGPFKTKFLHMDSVKTLYELFNIRQSYGMGYQDFLDLMQRAAEEKNWMPKADQSSKSTSNYDNYVPIAIVEEFAEQFLAGFINLMRQLGFDQEIPNL